MALTSIPESTPAMPASPSNPSQPADRPHRYFPSEPPAAGMPPIVRARATSSDPVEPDWERRPSITVGPAGSRDAGLAGGDHRVLQAGIDLMASLGGGTVHILPGEFTLRAAVRLRSGVSLQGSGPETILRKHRSHTTRLIEDTDWYDREITLDDPGDLDVGHDVCLQATNPHTGSRVVSKHTLTARSGRRFRLDRAPRENFWQMGDATASSLFPLLSGEFIESVTLRGLSLDGNRAENAPLDGNHSGCIFMQDCRDIHIEEVEAHHSHGDGISWQICHDVTVRNCHSHHNFGLGLHPGSGSQRPCMVDNRLEHNSIGIFFCWGVKHGLAEGNRIQDSLRHGISVGHRDTDNRIRCNSIERSGEVGIYFRPERGTDFCGHRNLVEGNTVRDTGGETAAAIHVQGAAHDLTFRRNTLEESRGPAERVGFRIHPEAERLLLEDNRITGMARDVVRE